MKKLCLNKMLFFGLFLSIITSPCFPVIIADVDLVDSPYVLAKKGASLAKPSTALPSSIESNETTQLSKHIRIAFFNTKSQEFVNAQGTAQRTIYYLSIPPAQSHKSYSATLPIPNWFMLTCAYSENQPKLSINIDISSFKADLSTKVIRYSNQVSITSPSQNMGFISGTLNDNTRLNSKCISSLIQEDPFPVVMNPQQMSGFFNSFADRKKEKGKHLNGYFYFTSPNADVLDFKLPFHSINFHNTDNSSNGTFLNKEKGNLGELAADITMQWLGFVKKDGKYNGGSDQGFDGVYCRQDALFMSDSKNYYKTANLPSILNEHVYAKINTRLNNMDCYGSPLQKQTAIYIRDFLAKRPDDTYLLAYVIIPDGKVKTLAKTPREVQADLDPTGHIKALKRDHIFDLGVVSERNKSFTEAAEFYQKAADKGDNEARFILGSYYEEGKGVTKDLQKAMHFYLLAAKENYAKAQNNLGWMYLHGIGATPDPKQAKYWLSLAAKQDLPEAHYNLGKMYEGNATIYDYYYKDAANHYRKAAEFGHAGAQNSLGGLYRNGLGFTVSEKEAARWFRKAAKQNLLEALINLKYMAEEGSADAQYSLALVHKKRGDYQKTIKWLSKALKQNMACAFYKFGQLYEKGEGVNKSKEEAAKYFQKAVEKGHLKAQHKL